MERLLVSCTCFNDDTNMSLIQRLKDIRKDHDWSLIMKELEVTKDLR